jgi:hypothetical protein
MVNKKDPQYKEKQKQKKLKRIEETKVKNDEANKRNKQERHFETINVIAKLKDNNIGTHYPAIKELLYKLNDYVEVGEKMEFSIPFPEMRKVIKGYLPLYKDEECVVVLRHME